MRELPHPFQTCIVLGHVCDREGKKEAKSKGNYTPPDIILERVRMDFGVLTEALGQQAAPGEALSRARRFGRHGSGGRRERHFVSPRSR